MRARSPWGRPSLALGLAALFALLVCAVSGYGSVEADGPDGQADDGPPPAPMWVGLENGGGDSGAFINASNEGDLSVIVALPADSSAEHEVTATITDGTTTTPVRAARAISGADTVVVSGIDASRLSDGTVTLRAKVASSSGVSPEATASIPKDTVRPVSHTEAPPQLADGSAVVAWYEVMETGAGLSRVELYADPPGDGPRATRALTDFSPAIRGRSFAYTSATADGEYGFYTRAYDVAGNVERPKAVADSTTSRSGPQPAGLRRL